MVGDLYMDACQCEICGERYWAGNTHVCPPYASLRAANIARNVEWTAGKDKLSLSFRGNELAGEVGEACNILKKLDRERMGMVGSKSSVAHLAEELADVIICVDLIAMDLGINLREAVVRKFNKTSAQRGLKTKMKEGGK